MVLPGTTRVSADKGYVKLPRAKLGGHRRSRPAQMHSIAQASIGSDSLFGGRYVGKPAPKDTRRFFDGVNTLNCSDPKSLRRLGIAYPKTTVLKMELSFARLNPPDAKGLAHPPRPTFTDADLEKSMNASFDALKRMEIQQKKKKDLGKLRERVVLTGWDLRKSKLTARQKEEQSHIDEKLKWERLAKNFRPGATKHTSSFPKLDSLPDLHKRSQSAPPSGNDDDDDDVPKGRKKKPPVPKQSDQPDSLKEEILDLARRETKLSRCQALLKDQLPQKDVFKKIDTLSALWAHGLSRPTATPRGISEPPRSCTWR